MKGRDILLCAAILAFGATAAYAAYTHQHPTAPTGAPLTGSMTAASSTDPISAIPPNAEIFSAHLGQSIEADGFTATPVAVIEDSRCPTDVQCIQAGTVQVSVKFTKAVLSHTSTFTLGTPITVAGVTGTLIAVTPDKMSKTTIAPGDYIFTFEVVP